MSSLRVPQRSAVLSSNAEEPYSSSDAFQSVLLLLRIDLFLMIF